MSLCHLLLFIPSVASQPEKLVEKLPDFFFFGQILNHDHSQEIYIVFPLVSINPILLFEKLNILHNMFVFHVHSYFNRFVESLQTCSISTHKPPN